MRLRPLPFAFAAAALLVTACDAPPASPGKSTSTVATSADTATATGDDDSCTKYASDLCAQAGEESATCASIKETTGLMPPAACAAGLADLDFAIKRIQEKGKVCTELAAKLCGDLGAETATCKLVNEQTVTFPPEQCAKMAENYDAVLADLVKMEARNKPLDSSAAATIAAGSAPSFGAADAKVTVVEFSDFQCPYCSRAAKALDAIKVDYADKARFLFRQFPLSFHENANLAAQASLAAHDQGKFWPYHDLLFANQQDLGRESLERYAQEVGLDMGKFRAALDSGANAKVVDAELAMGQTVFVDGTPTMFVNGKRVDNPTDPASIAKAIDDALAGK